MDHELLDKISHCIEFGKINKAAPFPPDMQGQEGADELTAQALKKGYRPDDILQKSCVNAMNKVGQKFSENKIFVPQMLMSAKAMGSAMQHLKPYFQSGEVKRKGKFIIGTVSGDLHDIGKNLVAMMIEGAGWEVIDLGVDVKAEQFIQAIEKSPDAYVGLSALLTTTMGNMEQIVKEIRSQYSNINISIGGAPVNKEFCERIKASFYSPNPQGLVDYLNKIAS